MIENLVQLFSNLPKEIAIILISALPVSELRGAIPVGVGIYKFSIIKTFILALIGNLSIVIPFLWFLNNLHVYFMKFYYYNKFFTWWFSKVKPKTKKIEKYEYLGLMLFVAIPLPATGAWSGCVASYLLGLDFWKSVISIIFGVFIAGIIVTILTVVTTQTIHLIF
jgi:uncharacterized membrane protein